MSKGQLMKQIPAIKTVMTAFPYWIDMGATLLDAEKMMNEHDISHLPVKQEGKLMGIVSHRDIKQLRDTAGVNVELVKDVCVFELYTVDMEEPLDNVVAHMANYHIGSAIIMKGERLAGVFTVNDACHYLVDYLRYQFRTESGDDSA